MLYKPGHDFFAQFADETVAITENVGADPTLPAAPASGSRSLIGQINPADIVKDDGDEKGYAAGSPLAAYDQEKGRTFNMTINMRVASLGTDSLFARCIYNGSGTKRYSLPQLALYYGTSASGRVFRHSVCNSLGVDFREGSGSELQATAQMIGVYDEAATLVVPTISNLRALGAPASWHDMTGFTIDGTSYRQELQGISFTQSHNVEMKGFRPYYVGVGANASRAVYDLLPHHVTVEGELSFHDEIKTTTNAWGNIVMTIGSNTVTLVNCRPSTRRQPGIESSGQLAWTTPFKADYISLA